MGLFKSPFPLRFLFKATLRGRSRMNAYARQERLVKLCMGGEGVVEKSCSLVRASRACSHEGSRDDDDDMLWASGYQGLLKIKE